MKIQFVFDIKTKELLSISDGAIDEAPSGSIVKLLDIEDLKQQLNLNSKLELFDSPYKEFIKIDDSFRTLYWDPKLQEIKIQNKTSEALMLLDSFMTSLNEFEFIMDGDLFKIRREEYSTLMSYASANFSQAYIQFRYFNKFLSKDQVNKLYELMNRELYILNKYREDLVSKIRNASSLEELYLICDVLSKRK